MLQVFSPFRIVVFFVAISICGIAVLPRLSVNLNPSNTSPVLNVSFSLPQTDPKSVEELATAPLENTLSQIPGVKQISSVSNYHRGNITLEFDKNSDLDFKKFEASSIIRQLYPKLPITLSYPQISQYDEAAEKENTPLIVYSLHANQAPYQIKKIAERLIALPTSQVEGIESAHISGANDLQITVKFDNNKLLQYGIGKTDITKSLQEIFTQQYPGAYQNASGQFFFLKVGKSLDDVKDIEKILLTTPSHKLIRLKDIATIYLEEQEYHRFYRINGKNAITISINAHKGVNRLQTGKTVKNIVAQAQKSLPQDYRLSIDYDDTEYLDKELNKLYKRSGLSILILVILILLIKRNIRYLLALFSGIIINISITVLIAWFLDINIHLYTLAGVAISFGLIVDNAIVMLDHINRKKNIAIFTALLAASLTTIAALLLVFFLPEEDKQNLFEFAQIIAVNLAVSLLVSFIYTPAAYLLFIKGDKTKKTSYTRKKWFAKFFRYYYKGILFLVGYRRSVVVLLILGFGIPVFMLPSQWENHKWYNNTIGSDYYQENIRPYSDKILGGALRLFVRDVFEKSGYRSSEKTKLYVNAQLPYGHTAAQMNEVMKKVEAYLKTVKGVDKFISRVYSGQYAQVTIEFLPAYESGSLPYVLKSRLISQSLDWGGVTWNVYGVGRGFSNSTGESLPSFRVEMKGYNYKILEKQAQKLQHKLIAHKRIQKVNIDERISYDQKSSEELVLAIDYQKLILAGSNLFEVTNTLKLLSKPRQPALHLQYQNELTPIYIKSTVADNFSKYDMNNSAIDLRTNKSIKLASFSSLSLQKTSNTIHKEDRQYIRMVGFDYYGSGKFGNQYLDDKLKEMKAEMPIGYTVEKNAWSWSFDKTKRQYGLLLILLIVVYFICAILFENLRQPFYIITTVPISFIGLFLVFSLFEFYFDQGGYAAFVLLGGVVVNAAIFVVNDLNNLKGKYYNRNVVKAITEKAQPILLTVLSTCFGLIPFLIEGQSEVFWFSLAVGTIGGLVFSLFSIFVVLPVFLIKRTY